MGESSGASIAFENVSPILRVASLEASVDYYVRVLGFTVDWQEPAVIASVSRGRCTLFLCEGDQGHAGGWVWVGVGDARALHAEYLARGARIRHSPTNYAWALEMQVEDLDGNILRMGSEPDEGAAIGEWLDMRGDRWVRSGDGWTRLDRS